MCSWGRDALVAAALVVLASAWCWLGATRSLELRDEGYILHRAERAAAGELPHRDFEALYGPGVYLATGLFQQLGGGDIVGVRAALAVMRGLAVGATYLVARSVAPLSVALLVTVLATFWWGRPTWNLNTPYAALYTLPVALGALALLVHAERRGSAVGRLAAGLLAGTSILFKQSLGLMLVGGMGLGVFASAMLRGRSAGRVESGLVLLAFAAAGLAPLVAVADYLGPVEYTIHFMPLHLVMAAVAHAAVRRGGAARALEVARELAPYGVGVVIPLAAIAVAYASVGALGRLWSGMFVLPRTLVDYFEPVSFPGPVAVVFALALLAGSALALGLQRRRPGIAAALLSVLALVFFLEIASETDPWVWTQLRLGIEQLWPAALGFAGALLFWRHPRPGPPLLVLCFHMLLCFQIFPRAGSTVWILLGATGPLLAWLVARAQSAALGAAASPLQRGVVLAGLALPLVWLALPSVRPILIDSEQAGRVALGIERTRGIELPPELVARLHMPSIRDLMNYLEREVSPGAPVFILGNEYLILHLSGRPNLFPDLEVRLFLQAWGLLPRGAVDEQRVIDRLCEEPSAPVVELVGTSSRRLRERLPAASDLLDGVYVEEARFGQIRVLRARTAEPRSSSGSPDARMGGPCSRRETG